MALKVGSTTIPTNGDYVVVNGTKCTKVTCGGTTVWEKVVFSSKEFAYTGGVQTWTVPVDGTYQLEVWGAQGGNNFKNNTNIGTGGKGGYAKGTIQLTAGQKLFICIGGYGVSGTPTNTTNLGLVGGGYNGGGDGGNTEGAGGGGATHIALGTSNRGVLSNYESHKSEILIVAGGGGGAAESTLYYSGSAPDGGAGGGTNGGVNYGTDSSGCGSKATQSQGGTHPSTDSTYSYNGKFGRGGDNSYGWEGGGGGGGWYGGYAGGNYNGGRPGGGGSGYTGGVSSGSMSNGKQEGNGKAKITFISN